MQTSWLAQHEYLAAWSGAIASGLGALIALVAMVRQPRPAGVPLKWNSIILRVGFLLCLSGILAPATSTEVRHIMSGLCALMLGSLIVRPE